MMTTLKQNNKKCTESSDFAQVSLAPSGTKKLLPGMPSQFPTKARDSCASAALMQTILADDYRDTLEGDQTAASLSKMQDCSPCLVR
jgi:hypothetical protein